MTRLLVSVRSAAEAELALAGGADVIDVKEPGRGALGAADPSVWLEILSRIAGRALTSAALGELLDGQIEARAAAASGFGYAKIGLAGCLNRGGWLARWSAAVAALPPGVDAVPVAYADSSAAAALPPSAALALAARSRSRLLLIDTYDKARGGLLDHLPVKSLRRLTQQAKAVNVRLALAGSLDAAAVEKLLPLAPAYIGVRGAACRGGREGALDAALVGALAELVHPSSGAAQPAAPPRRHLTCRLLAPYCGGNAAASAGKR